MKQIFIWIKKYFFQVFHDRFLNKSFIKSKIFKNFFSGWFFWVASFSVRGPLYSVPYTTYLHILIWHIKQTLTPVKTKNILCLVLKDIGTKHILVHSVVYHKGGCNSTAFHRTEGNLILCGGITFMTHFMEQKLRQIVKNFLLFCCLSTNYD